MAKRKNACRRCGGYAIVEQYHRHDWIHCFSCGDMVPVTMEVPRADFARLNEMDRRRAGTN